MSDISKQICPGLVLRIVKRLVEGRVEFYIENSTEFIFLFQFLIKEPENVKFEDEELEKYVQVLPRTNFEFMRCSVEGAFSYKYEFKYQKLKPEPVTKEVDITEGLGLIITQQDTEQRILIDLVNKTEMQVHFELTILELSGIRSTCGKTLFAIDADGKSKTEICELNFDGVWSYKYSFTYSFNDPSDNPVV
jgi:hypothetical protein